MPTGLRSLRRALLALFAAAAVGAAVAVPAAAPAQAQWWSGIWTGPWPWLTTPYFGVPMLGMPLPLLGMPSPLLGPSMLGATASMGTPAGQGMGMHAGPGMGMGMHRMGHHHGPRGGTDPRTSVMLYEGFYLPSSITVPVGTTVSWVNRSGRPVTLQVQGVDTPRTVPPGGRFAALYAVPGTFTFTSDLAFEGNVGTVVVSDAPASMSAPSAPMGPGMTAPGAPGMRGPTAPAMTPTPAAAPGGAPSGAAPSGATGGTGPTGPGTRP